MGTLNLYYLINLYIILCKDELSYCSCNSVLQGFDGPANILMKGDVF